MFKVPKKVNRHVFKAVNILSEGSIKKQISTAVILDQVKYQMRHLVPVTNVERAVQNSLNHLSDFGLIKRVGPNRFSIGQTYAPRVAHPLRPDATDQGLSYLAGSRKRRASDDEPSTSRRREQIEDSLSSDEFDQIRKRVHRNDSKLQRSRKSVVKDRQHFLQTPLGYEGECCSCVPVHESKCIYHNISFNSDTSDVHAEPVHQILEAPELCQDFPSCSSKQLNEAGRCDSNTVSTIEQNTASKEQAKNLRVSTSSVADSTTTTYTANSMGEQRRPSKEDTEKLQASTSSAADPTKTTDAANAMGKTLPESSNMTKLQSANTSCSYYV